MKNIVITLLLLLGMCSASAQLIKEKEPVDPKYLAGAVPVVDGKVTFSCDIPIEVEVPTDSLYRSIHRWLNLYFNPQDVLKRADTGSDREKKIHEIGIVQYLIFKKTALVLDRSQIIYRLMIQQKDKNLHVEMTDISYYYEEERDPVKMTAEEWITDEFAFNRKKTDFKSTTGKFRIKTIDLFTDIRVELSDFMLSEQMKYLEEKPDFIGGEEALMEFITQNLKYPSYEANHDIQGCVMLSFTIEKDGSITDINVLSTPSKGLANEAVRVVKKMPKWKPAAKGGQPVKTSYCMPVTFNLK